MSFLKTTGLDLELVAVKAGRIVRRRPVSDRELELEKRREEERKAALERAERKGEEG